MRATERIIRLGTVLFRTGLFLPIIYRKIAESTFRPLIGISLNESGWQKCDINRWTLIRPHRDRSASSMRFEGRAFDRCRRQ